jgi:hypothetical protein
MSNIRKTIISALLFTAMTVLLVAVLPANAKASRPGYYTISYSTNGISGVTVPASFEVRDGSLYGLSSQIPTRANYTFKGYDTSTAANTVRYTAGQGNLRASSNLTLYPVWEPKNPSSGIKTFNYGGNLDAPKSAGFLSNTPSKVQMYYDKSQKSFTFGGWCVHDQGIKSYTYQVSGPGFTASNIKNFGWTTRADVAACTPDVRTTLGVNKKASFNNCGYSGSVDMSKLNAGDYKLTVYGVPNAGANFAVCEISFNLRPTGTAYVIFNANGGKGASNVKQLVTYGANNKLNPPSFTKSGYEVLGFSTNKKATTPDYKLGVSYPFNGVKNNTTLYAVWGKKTVTPVPPTPTVTKYFKVVIDANGGTFHDGTTRYERSYPVGTTVTIDFGKEPYSQFLIWLKGNGLGKAMEKPGYTFANNYSTNPNATPGSSSNSLVFTAKSDITLYPVWLNTTSKGGIWYKSNPRNNGYANVSMYVDKANANRFANELQIFVLENGAKRKSINDKEHWIADTIRELSQNMIANFVYDTIRYDVGTAIKNLVFDKTTDNIAKFNKLTEMVKKGVDSYNVAYAICENTVYTMNVGNDKTFKRNFDLLEKVYKQLVSQGVYNGEHGTANVNGGLFIQIDTDTSALFFSDGAAALASKYGLPVIGNTGIDYNALIRDKGVNWIDEKYLQKPDSYYNKENDTLFTALYKVLSLTDGSKKISGPEVI